MNNLNSVLIEGNLTRDPELSYTGKGTAVVKLGVANNRYFKQEDELQKETSFFDVTVWGRQAEICEQYLKKGRGVRVVGRLKQDRWQDPEGNPRSKVEIVAEHVEFRPEKKNGNEAEGGEGDTAAAETEAETESNEAAAKVPF